MDELHEAIEGMVNAMGAAVEMTSFLFKLLVEKGFTREEALIMAKDYLLGMITRGKDEEKQG